MFKVTYDPTALARWKNATLNACRKVENHTLRAVDKARDAVHRATAPKSAEPVAWLIHHHDGRETMTLFPSVVDALREHTQSISPLYFHPAPADGLREALRLVTEQPR